jgi:hypothetical protein
MAGSPNEVTGKLTTSKELSTDRDSTAAELPFERSPSPDPPTLPATTFEGLSRPRTPRIAPRRSLSLEPPKRPEITITRTSSLEDLGPSERSTTPDMEPHANTMRKNAAA